MVPIHSIIILDYSIHLIQSKFIFIRLFFICFFSHNVPSNDQMNNQMQVALWSSGMILALGARGPEFDSPLGPFFVLFSLIQQTRILTFFYYQIITIFYLINYTLLTLLFPNDSDLPRNPPFDNFSNTL